MKIWTNDEVKYFLKNCQKKTVEDLAQALNRPVGSVVMMSRKYRLLEEHGYELSVDNLMIGENKLREVILKK